MKSKAGSVLDAARKVVPVAADAEPVLPPATADTSARNNTVAPTNLKQECIGDIRVPFSRLALRSRVATRDLSINPCRDNVNASQNFKLDNLSKYRWKRLVSLHIVVCFVRRRR